MKVSGMADEIGNKWGNLRARVPQKHFTERRLGRQRAQFTEERITTADYLSKVIKAALPNSTIAHVRESERARGDKRRRRRRSSYLQLIITSVIWPRWICTIGSLDFRHHYSWDWTEGFTAAYS